MDKTHKTIMKLTLKTQNQILKLSLGPNRQTWSQNQRVTLKQRRRFG